MAKKRKSINRHKQVDKNKRLQLNNSDPIKRKGSSHHGKEDNDQRLERHILHFLRLRHQRKTNTNTSTNVDMNKSKDDDERKVKESGNNDIKMKGKSQGGVSSGKLFNNALSLSFMMHQDKVGHSADDDADGDADIFFSSVSFLTSFLVNGIDQSSSLSSSSEMNDVKSSISKAHVASLMLPWAIESLILHSKRGTGSSKTKEGKETSFNEGLVWKTIALCLEMLFIGTANEYKIDQKIQASSGEKEQSHDETLLNIVHQMDAKSKSTAGSKDGIQCKDTLGSVLTQGTLNKLIPLTIMSISSASTKNIQEDKERGMIAMFATRSYCLLVMSTFYHPTMDYVCNSLVPLIDDMITRSNDISLAKKDNQKSNLLDQNNVNQKNCEALVTFVTLKHLDNIQQTGRATNPKKNFILLSSVKMLSSFSKLSRVSLKIDQSIMLKKNQAGKQLESGIVKPLDENVNATMVKKILWHGLFDPEHHMDGFNTMRLEVPTIESTNERSSSKAGPNTPKSGHSCYQKKLFESIQSLFIVSVEDKDKFNEIVTYLDLVSMLIDGFMQQSIEFQNRMKQNTHSKKNDSTRVDKLALTQFRFWCCVFNPLILLLKNTEQIRSHSTDLETLLVSLNQCLTSLSRNDSYLPSYDDPNNQHLNYLTAVGQIVLESMESESTEQHHSHGYHQYFHSIKILFSLNHHIFHNKLPHIIYVMSKNALIAEDEIGHASLLLSSICSTYEKLRQMGHFLRAILGCFDTRILDESFDSSTLNGKSITHHNSFSFLLHNKGFIPSFFAAIRSLPSGQIQEIWAILDEFISLIQREKIEDIGTVVDVFVMFLKAVRVTPFNAKMLLDSCESSMKTSVHKLIGIENMNDPSAVFDIGCKVSNTGLYLCGWIVSVHIKCSFWMNEMPHDVAGTTDEFSHHICGLPLVPLLLNTVQSELKGDENKKHELGSLQHLASHRIEQLHSNIYLQQQHEGIYSLSTDESECRSMTMISEAKLLVDFIVFSAQTRKFSDDNRGNSLANAHQVAGWKIVAQTLSTWAPYSEAKHVEQFLRWMFFTLATNINTESTLTFINVPARNERIPSLIHREESAVAVALLHDASFFEINEIHKRFAKVGSMSAIDQIQLCLPGEIKKGIFNVQPLTSEVFSDIKKVGKGLNLDSKIVDSINGNRLEEALCIMDNLSQLSSQYFSKADATVLTDAALRINVAINFLIQSSSSLPSSTSKIMIKLTYTCRTVFARALTLAGDKVSLLMSNSFSLRDLINHFVEILGYELYRNLDEEQKMMIITTTSQILRSILIFSLQLYEDDDSYLVSLSKSFDKLSRSSFDMETKIALFRPLFREMTSFAQHLPSGFNTKNKESGVEIRNVFGKLSKLSINLLEQNFKSIKENQTLDDIDAEGILFTADALNLHCACMLESKVSLKSQIQEIVETLYVLCTKTVTSSCQQDLPNESRLVSASLYFLCFISSPATKGGDMLGQVNITANLQKLTAYLVTYQGIGNPMLDAAYSEQLLCRSPQEIHVLLEDLLMHIKESTDLYESVPALLYCFDIMIRALVGESQRQVLASKAMYFLYLASGSICPPPKASNMKVMWSIHTNIALSFLVSLIQKKDVIILKGSHVANILATIGSIYQEIDMESTENSSSVDDSVYLSSCGVVNILLRQYTKHLYGCVPSFNCVLRCLLKHVMVCQSELGKKETGSIKQSIQEFTKICEGLPEHKDIFKKHIMYLVVDYIDVLVSGRIQSWRKAQLEPAIFFLLETLSIYENQQLNSMVHSTGKPFLQSIFKNFQKHQYKGQF